jgi:nitroreductase
MDILEALHTRRSIRSYTDEGISAEEVRILLDAAMVAPSAGNGRPWQFIIIDDQVLLDKIPSVNPYAAMAPKAPMGILVCGDTSLEKYAGYWVQDCSAAIENMLLAAVSLELGAVWTGVHPMPDRVKGFRELCKLPEHIIPLGYVVLGRPQNAPKRLSRFEPEKVHLNAFGNKML